jgi:hypothetical protein
MPDNAQSPTILMPVFNERATLESADAERRWISDVMTCHKAMRTDLFRSRQLRERGL